MRFFREAHSYLATIIFVFCLVVGSVKPSHAGVACPIMLYDGKINQGTVSVSFMNKGKVPMSELELYCTPLQGQRGSAPIATPKQDCSIPELLTQFLLPTPARLREPCRCP